MIVISPEPMSVTTGGTISITFTVRVIVPVLKLESETVYSTGYTPGTVQFTEPEIVIHDVRSPSSISNAVAPDSM